MSKVETLKVAVTDLLGDEIVRSKIDCGQLTIDVSSLNLLKVMVNLRDNKATLFEQCVDLCGVDYLEFGGNYQGDRFAVIYNLLSFTHNWRLRVRVFVADADLPMLPSLVEVWAGLNWLEREVFDMFGIAFAGHPDLRRILTDYGFIGHPLRKDFPLSGHVEMRYDEEQKRIIYQPVTIEPREITPRIIREDSYNGGN